jgi:hypothetical protein
MRVRCREFYRYLGTGLPPMRMDLLEPIEILLGSLRRVTFMNIDSKFINC